MCITLHFKTLKNNNHLEAQIQSSCKSSCSSSKSLKCSNSLNNFASSAKRTQCDLTLLGKSFIYKIKRTGCTESGSFRSYSRSVRSFRPGSFRLDFWGESFRPSMGGSFRPYFIGGSFRPDFWGGSFRPDLFILEKQIR